MSKVKQAEQLLLWSAVVLAAGILLMAIGAEYRLVYSAAIMALVYGRTLTLAGAVGFVVGLGWLIIALTRVAKPRSRVIGRPQ